MGLHKFFGSIVEMVGLQVTYVCRYTNKKIVLLSPVLQPSGFGEWTIANLSRAQIHTYPQMYIHSSTELEDQYGYGVSIYVYLISFVSEICIEETNLSEYYVVVR